MNAVFLALAALQSEYDARKLSRDWNLGALEPKFAALWDAAERRAAEAPGLVLMPDEVEAQRAVLARATERDARLLDLVADAIGRAEYREHVSRDFRRALIGASAEVILGTRHADRVFCPMFAAR